MRQTLITGDDLDWLFDTHAKRAPQADKDRTQFAILHGNEDSPDKIELFDRNRYDADPFAVIVP